MKRDGGKQETRASNRDATGSNLLRELGLGFFCWASTRSRSLARRRAEMSCSHATRYVVSYVEYYVVVFVV